MKRPLRFAIAFAVALTFLPFLPLFVERTMTHVMFVNGGGAIEWGWKVCTLRSYWADYHYFRLQQHPALWLAVNVALAFIYAMATALFVDLIPGRKRASAGRDASITQLDET